MMRTLLPLDRLKPRRTALWAGAAALLALLVAYVAVLPQGQAMATQAVQGLVAHLAGNTPLPNALIYLLVGCAVACAGRIGRLAGVTAPRRPPPAEPGAYLRDRILNVQWEWTYDAQRRPKGLWAACPDCATRLVSFVTRPPEERRIKLYCENCRSTMLSEPGDREVLIARVSRQIERKLRTGEWRDSQAHTLSGL